MEIPGYVYGSIAPTFTAFHDDGRFDATGQRALLDFMRYRGGVSAYFVRSGMGQMYTFGMSDAKELIECACSHLAQRSPVLAGCSGIWDRNRDTPPDPDRYLAESIELGRFAADCGAAGVVYTIPEGIAPKSGQTHDEVTLQYFEHVCAKVQLPVFIYQPPGTAPEYHLNAQSIARLADIDNLMGAKASYSDGYYVYQLIRATAEKRFAFIVGCEMIFYAGLYAGARACIGQGCVLNPHVINAVQSNFETDDRDGALAAQDAVNRLVETCSNPQDFYKRFATECGYPVGVKPRVMSSNPYMTNPVPLTDAAYATCKAAIEQEDRRFA